MEKQCWNCKSFKKDVKNKEEFCDKTKERVYVNYPACELYEFDSKSGNYEL